MSDDKRSIPGDFEIIRCDLPVISSFEYTRDRLGNPRSIVREDGYTTYYEYDPKSQLIGELQRDGQGQDVYAWTWDYDPAGNRTVQTLNGVATYYSYNAGNELTAETTGAQTTYYSYDACGNTTVQQAPGGTTYYHWDYENLLTQIDLPGDAHNYFGYDADSKRVTKRDSEGFTRFIYQGPDMLKLLQEQDEDEELVAHYTMGNGLEAMRRESASSFYHYDCLGSTFELTDANEDVTDSYLYNAWGEVPGRMGSTVNAHRYVGKLRYYRMPDGCRYHVGHRHLDALLGRFISVDRLRGEGNWYTYADCQPSIYTDPTGDSPLLYAIVGGVVLVVAGILVYAWGHRGIRPFTLAEKDKLKPYIDQFGACPTVKSLVDSFNLLGYDDTLSSEVSGETRAHFMFWGKYTVLSPRGTDFPGWDALQTLIHEALHSKCCWKSMRGQPDDPNSPHGRVTHWAEKLAEAVRRKNCCLPRNLCEVINNGQTPKY